MQNQNAQLVNWAHLPAKGEVVDLTSALTRIAALEADTRALEKAIAEKAKVIADKDRMYEALYKELQMARLRLGGSASSLQDLTRPTEPEGPSEAEKQLKDQLKKSEKMASTLADRNAFLERSLAEAQATLNTLGSKPAVKDELESEIQELRQRNLDEQRLREESEGELNRLRQKTEVEQKSQRESEAELLQIRQDQDAVIQQLRQEKDAEIATLKREVEAGLQRYQITAAELEATKSVVAVTEPAKPETAVPTESPSTVSHPEPEDSLETRLAQLEQGSPEDLAFFEQCKLEIKTIKDAADAIENREVADSDFCSKYLLAVAQPHRRIQPSLYLAQLDDWSPVISLLDKMRAETLDRAEEKLSIKVIAPTPGLTKFDPSLHEESPNHRRSAPANHPEFGGMVYDVINPGFQIGGKVATKAYVKIYTAS